MMTKPLPFIILVLMRVIALSRRSKTDYSKLGLGSFTTTCNTTLQGISPSKAALERLSVAEQEKAKALGN